MRALRPVLGWYRLMMRLNRHFWAMTAFNGIGLPFVILLAFGQRVDADGRTRILIGSIVLGLAMVAMRRASFGLVFDRHFGQRDLVATTGLSRDGYLAAYALEAFTLTCLPLCVLGAGLVMPEVRLPTSWEWLVPYALLGGTLFGVGLLFGAVAGSLPAVSLLVNAATLFVAAFCPVSYPVERVPELMRPIVAQLPPSLAAEQMAALWDGGSLLVTPLAVLAAWCAGLLVLGWRLVPWTDRA